MKSNILITTAKEFAKNALQLMTPEDIVLFAIPSGVNFILQEELAQMTENLIVAICIFFAAVIGLRLNVAVAIFEIALGAIVGNFLGIKPSPWMNTFADIGSMLLIFIAGSDIDIPFLKRNYKQIGVMGMASFIFPFLAIMGYGFYFGHWNTNMTLLMAIACSTTSIAVVYPILRDSGMLKQDLGKTLLGVAFLPDFLVTVALFVFFTKIDLQTAFLIFLLIVSIIATKKVSEGYFFKRFQGQTSSEIKLRFIFMILFIMAFISEKGQVHASLAVFILGILMSGLMEEKQETNSKLRAVAFSIFVPTFYFKAGLLFSFSAVIANYGIIFLILAIAFGAKFIGIYLTGKKHLKENTLYGATLMNARLTFGTIAASYGVTHGIINQQYFSILISVIILASAFAILFVGKLPFSHVRE